MTRRSENTHRNIFVGSFGGPDWRLLAERLRSSGYDVTQATSPDSFIGEAVGSGTDLIIIDRAGASVADAHLDERLDRNPTVKDVPVLVLCAKDEEESIGTDTNFGRVDYLARPFSIGEFLSRVKAVLRVAYSEDGIQQKEMRDPGTRLYNRLYFDERVKKEMDRARRYGRELAVVLIDIDGLGKINAEFDHKTGDAILRSLADILLSGTRLSDVIARFGGDEFVLILPETKAGDAGILTERLRATFADRTIIRSGNEVRATVTCGIASYPDHAGDVDTLVRMADSALCRGRAEGRNRTIVAFSDTGEAAWGGLNTGPTILLVAGNDYSRSVASIVLRASGYEVIETADGTSAVELAKSSHPDLVLMDVHLDGADGLEVTRRLMSMKETQDIPILALTSNSVAGELERFVQAGRYGHITKPLDPNSL
ncbi:diguanylate cyclase, partial [bacterium]|nr:diguanylate cyclase [bacterium]